MKELGFVEYIARKFRARKPVVKGIGDDCAVVEYTKDKYMLFTCDMIIEGTHFGADATPFQIGWKAAAVNVSDIAAMGGVPKYALVSAGIPKKRGMNFLKEITKGIEAVCRKFNILVVGGDTNTADKTVLNVTLIGEVEKKRLITRSGAKAGDMIFVTGALGEGGFKHLRFLPRLKEARILAKNFRINSMIDLSDGLNLDLYRLTRASSAGARIYKSLMPLSENSAPIEKAISSGEDFELLFTASKLESKKIIKGMTRRRDLPITLIGEIVKEPGVRLVEEEGKVRLLKPGGFRHL